MADGEVSLRPMALRPGGITSGNPFMTFGKGAGVGLVKKVRRVAAFGVAFGPSVTYVSVCLPGIGAWLDDASTDNPRNIHISYRFKKAAISGRSGRRNLQGRS
jgi:hypothetical protein